MRIAISVSSTILFLGLVGCDSDVRVEITDGESRQKYIETLERQGFTFRVERDGVIHVDASHKELEARMHEYEVWKQAELKREGVR